MSALAVVFATLMWSCERSGPPASSAQRANVASVSRLEKGAYAVLGEASTAQAARGEGPHQIVLAYDRRKYSGTPAEEPLTYVAIDPTDYAPLYIEGEPVLTKDAEGKTTLFVTLARTNASRIEAFSGAHLGGRIAMVVDGEVVSLHKIRTVITGGQLQVTRCTDNACEAIRAKLME